MFAFDSVSVSFSAVRVCACVCFCVETCRKSLTFVKIGEKNVIVSASKLKQARLDHTWCSSYSLTYTHTCTHSHSSNLLKILALVFVAANESETQPHQRCTAADCAAFASGAAMILLTRIVGWSSVRMQVLSASSCLYVRFVDLICCALSEQKRLSTGHPVCFVLRLYVCMC